MSPAGECAGRVAIVTGGSRGIGKAIALRLAAEGASVCVTGRTAHPGTHPLPGSLDETVEEIRAGGGTATAVAADLSDPAFERATIVAAAHEAFGAPVDILVNNAAAPRTFDLDLEHTPRSVFMEALEVNVWAAWELSALVLPDMRARGRGWIVNVSSRSAGPKIGPPYPPSQVGAQVLYGSTKAMLDRMTTGVAMELADDHIAVNALAPEAAILTENASTLIDVPASIVEPVETFAEATLALCTGDPAVLTGRVAYSLSLLVELQQPVRTLDGSARLPGWQPDEIARSRLHSGYLRDL
jgi:NAD(P)-dependent dehydrogenase (short-subunit alcohol dehydrogenase family)